jgi:hypothetical protein
LLLTEQQQLSEKKVANLSKAARAKELTKPHIREEIKGAAGSHRTR